MRYYKHELWGSGLVAQLVVVFVVGEESLDVTVLF